MLWTLAVEPWDCVRFLLLFEVAVFDRLRDLTGIFSEFGWSANLLQLVCGLEKIIFALGNKPATHPLCPGMSSKLQVGSRRPLRWLGSVYGDQRRGRQGGRRLRIASFS